MLFNYEYRTSGNEPRRGSLRARTRDDVYAELKARGIRPSRVFEAPGFLNKLFGKGKRWLAILALGTVLTLTLYLLSKNAGLKVLLKPIPPESRPVQRSAETLTSDPALKAELNKFIEERQAAEREYRIRFLNRIKAGTLSKEEANRIFRAMGMEEVQ